MVAPAVSPRPELGRGREQTFAAFQNILDGANEFIRPAVVQNRTAQGEKEALSDVKERGPEWGLKQLKGSSSTVAIGSAERTRRNAAMRETGGPTKAAAEKLEGDADNAFDFFARSVGGAAARSDSFDKLDPNFRSGVAAMMQAAEAEGIDLKITSAYRSPELQAKLYEDALKKYGSAAAARKWVAPPGNSMHNKGMAVDFAGSNGGLLRDANSREAKWLKANAERFGLAVPLSNEPWQVEPAGARGGGSGVAKSVTVPGSPEYELETLNKSTFEPRVPFTVRDQAFNAAADRVITARATSALEEGMRAAMQRADGDIGVLKKELDKVRTQVMGELPDDLPGLKTELQAQYDRGRIAAERQAVELSQKRVMQRQNEALNQIVTGTKSEAERLALTGATAAELADHMAQATDTLAQFGPREGFEIAGRTYPPDPSRAGSISVDAIATSMLEVATGARRMMIEADFMRSAAPGQYVDEFRRQVFSGNSPLPAGESLEVLRKMESQARAAESARRTAAEAERRRLEKGMDETINAYVAMGEAGVPVAIPEAERARILGALSPHPDLQREAQIAFQVADAQVATHGMTGSELMRYVDVIRGDMAAAAERGELDLGGAAIIESLEDRVKKVQDAISAETIGLPLIEQLTLNGATADEVNYDGLREQAGGNEDVLQAINEVEAFHRDAERIKGLSAADRDAILEDARASLAVLAAKGEGFGAKALTTQKVLDRLEEWSDHRQSMAANEPMKFARSVGLTMPGLEDAETMDQVGAVIAERVNLLAPHTVSEGVEYPVPLSQIELDGISEVFKASSRSQQATFLASVAELGENQAMAIFSRIGQAEPVVFAAGAVYSMGNQQAAGVILRGNADIKLEGGSVIDVAAARSQALGPLISEGVTQAGDAIPPILSNAGVETADRVAAAYARGAALAEGGRAITVDDLARGYEIALGAQSDGTGGIAETRYGATILPPGWDRRRINRTIGGLTDAQLERVAGGVVEDRKGRPISAEELERSIYGLRPAPDNEFTLVPVDRNGDVFLTNNGGPLGVLTFDLREFQ